MTAAAKEIFAHELSGKSQRAPRPLTPPHAPAHVSTQPPTIQRKAACACGGGCPSCQEPEAPQLRPKLHIGHAADPAEREADAVAELVMNMPAPAHTSSPTPPAPSAPRAAHEVARAAGEPLDAATRDFFEPRFGHDFGGVRVHADARAAESARALGARAFTVERDIVFGEGQYAPGTERGRRLLAHELTHVLQQSHPGDAARGGLTVSHRASGPVVQRQPDDDDLVEVIISPRGDDRYIDNLCKGLGFTLLFSGIYVFYDDPLKKLGIPNAWLDRGVTDAREHSPTIHPDRETALAAIAGLSGNWYAYWITANNIILPTIVSPSSAPKICSLIPGLYEKVGEWADETADMFVQMAVGMTVARLLPAAVMKLGDVPLTAKLPRLSTLPAKTSPPATRTTAGATTTTGTKTTTGTTTGRTTPHAVTTTKTPTGNAPAQTTAKRPLPKPGETPEAYYERTRGPQEPALADVPPAMKQLTVDSAKRNMNVAAIEHNLADPEAVWVHYLTQGGYQNIMRTQKMQGKGGKVGHQEGLRVVPGPFSEGAGLRTGATYLDLKVKSKTAKGNVTEFFHTQGATFTEPGGGAIQVQVIRVGYTDGSHAVRVGSDRWKLTTPKGNVREMDTETLIQLGERPTEGLKMPTR